MTATRTPAGPSAGHGTGPGTGTGGPGIAGLCVRLTAGGRPGAGPDGGRIVRALTWARTGGHALVLHADGSAAGVSPPLTSPAPASARCGRIGGRPRAGNARCTRCTYRSGSGSPPGGPDRCDLR